MSLAGKVTLITGGTGALGRSVCAVFQEAGSRVHTTYIMDDEARKMGEVLPEVTCHKVDLTDEEAVRALVSGLPALDILINVVGGFAMAPITETSLADWQRMQRMNLDTVFLTCREAIRRMEGQGAGRIINVGAFAVTRKPAGMAAYTTSKAAVLHLTEVLAEETLAGGITVNAVLPTVMDTPGNRAAMPDADVSTWVPLGNVARAMVFLAEADAWPITGACIPLRGHL